MVDEDIALGELGSDRSVLAKRIARDERGIVGQSRGARDLVQPAEVDRAVGHINVRGAERAIALALLESKLTLQQITQRLGHRCLELDAKHGALLAPCQLLLDRLEKVGG